MNDPREVATDQLGRRVPGHPLDGVGQVREVAAIVGGEDDVGRVLDQEPVALLGFAKLALESIALAHVPDGAVGARELALVIERAECAELGRDRPAVAMEKVEPAPDLLEFRRHPGRPVDLGDVL